MDSVKRDSAIKENKFLRYHKDPNPTIKKLITVTNNSIIGDVYLWDVIWSRQIAVRNIAKLLVLVTCESSAILISSSKVTCDASVRAVS